jgi:hypothetical protein
VNRRAGKHTDLGLNRRRSVRYKVFCFRTSKNGPSRGPKKSVQLNPLRPTLAEYQRRYTELRDLAHHTALERTKIPGVALSLTHINQDAIDSQQHVWAPAYIPGTPGGFDWAGHLRRMRNHLDRFEVAIWAYDGELPVHEVLCGLALGKPSVARDNLTITLLEGSPVRTHPLRGHVLRIVLEAAEAYGMALGAEVLRIARPLPSALPKYQAYGFSLVNRRGEDPYCYRRIV